MAQSFVNPNTNYTPIIKPYVPSAYKEFGEVQKNLQKDYDEAQLQYDALQEASDNMKAIDWLPADQAAKKQIFEKTKKDIEEAAKSGDYENKGRMVRKLVRNFQEQYAPILNNYNADIKQREEIMKFDKITDPVERQRAYQKLREIYNLPNGQETPIEYDQKGRVKVKPYQSFNAAADVDILDKADKLANGWKSDKNVQIPYKVTMKDGTEIWQQKSIEQASEQEIYNYLHSELAKQPDTLGFLKQKKILYGDDYNAEKAISDAANFAAKKHGFIKTDLDYKFDPASTAEANRKAVSSTGIFASSSTDYKVNIDNLNKTKQDLIVQQQDLTNRFNNASDPNIKSELQQQLNNINHKVRLQNEFQNNIEQKIGWNWGKEYADYANKARKEGTQLISPDEFKKLSSSSPYDDYTNTYIAGKYGIENGKLLSNTRNKYSNAIEVGNKNNSFNQEHELIVGNESTAVGQYTENLNKAAKNGTLELINQDGSQFNIEEQFKDLDLENTHILPTKSLIGGKPGFAITATKKDGSSKKTYYVTMDDNTSNKEDYQQIGYDLLSQANNSKYADAPDKRKQLAETGFMQIGYSNIGNELSNMNLPLVKGGTMQNPVELPLSNGLKVQVINGQGITYYRIALPKENGRVKLLENPITHKSSFGSEEDLMKVWGMYNVNNSNPSLLKAVE